MSDASCKIRRICVFGASASGIADCYIQAARDVGRLIARHGWAMVFGAGDAGLMGAAARGAAERGGEIIGVIPKKLNVPGIYYENCNRRIQTETMHERKAVMESLSDGYIALAGGFGTIEEFMETVTLKQLRYMDSPIALLNTEGYYDDLIRQLERCVEEGFTNPDFSKLYYVAKTPLEAVEYLRSYKGMQIRDKLMDAGGGSVAQPGVIL